MKAYSLYGINDLRYIDSEYPECPSGWCVVQVKATGICSSDIPRIFTKGTYHFPTIPGHEVAGVVVSVADEENRGLLNKKVGIFPLIPCKKCEQCRKGHYEMCADYDYVGSRRDGGFAEYVAVPVWNTIVLDDSVSFTAAAMMEPLAVSLHAVNQADIHEGDTVAVVGTGMIGIAIAQWALTKNPRCVVVYGASEKKRTTIEKIRGVAFASVNTIDREFDVVIEAVGTNAAIESAITLTKASGTLVLVGNPEGDITRAQNTYWRILRKQLHVVGSWNSCYAEEGDSDWSAVAAALSAHTVDTDALISHRLAETELMRGLEIMRDHSEPFLRIMIEWGKNDSEKE
jgi:L-iditol 2-dehydrogenase